MDFLIYLGVILVIAALFFIRTFTEGNNAMIFVVLFSVIGMLLVVNSPPEIITGTNATLIFNGTTVVGSTAVFITEEFTVLGFGTTNFFILVFLGLMILGIMRMMNGSNLEEELKTDR